LNPAKKFVMFFYKFIIFYTTIIFASSAGAQNTSYPAVWAWKVEGAQRSVYFLGEMHDFKGRFGLKIDYSLGEKILKISDEVWVEILQDEEDKTVPGSVLEKRISTENWNSIKRIIGIEVRKLLAGIASEEKIMSYTEAYIDSVRKSSPLDAMASLGMLHALQARKKNPLDNLAYPGLRKFFFPSQGKTYLSNLRFIESTDSVARAWRQTCADKDADPVFSWLLQDISMADKFGDQLLDVFWRSPVDLPALNQAMASNPFGDLTMRCSISPRNSEWLPKILQTLSTPGPTTTFLFGVGHFAGEKGLIEKLKTAGYVDIKRIYELEK
jgi:uncharacterized protein YbaP (TraB family)